MGISRKPPDWYIRRNCRSILGDDSIGIYVSADDVYSGEMLYTAKNLFEEDSNTIWIASLDNHMYHDLSSNTIENTMIPQDYTGIIR